MAGKECNVQVDFTRHIVNKILSENIEKIPASALSELRKRLGRAEDKYRYSIYGGDPSRLHDFLKSQDWRDLEDYAEKMNIEWVLIAILKRAYEKYKDACPSLAEAIRIELDRLENKAKGGKGEEITAEAVYRKLKFEGYKVDMNNDTIIINEPFLTAELRVVGGRIEYTICRKGKAGTLDAVLAKIEKIKEL
ncbi:MAG: hypothetical protein LRS48_06545 [Desulfurococcales archaeon]|nr:hypothetical protein [Desulfurococcales archaeon]